MLFRSAAFVAFLLLASVARADTVLGFGASGMPGTDARAGYENIGSAPDGFRGFTGSRGGDGQRGQDGGNASSASAGGAGGTIVFLLEKDPANPAQLHYHAKVNGADKDGTVPLQGLDHITLAAQGGRGGNGALGGNGQDGGRGGEGGEADQFHFSSGDGGRGGDGGSAGQSANGANGGPGGSILVQVRKGQEELAQLIRADVSGGPGGRAPIGSPRAGRGGQGGQPGNNCYYHSTEGYKCVSRGFQGMNGMDGRPSFGLSQPGSPGAPGRYAVEVLE